MQKYWTGSGWETDAAKLGEGWQTKFKYGASTRKNGPATAFFQNASEADDFRAGRGLFATPANGGTASSGSSGSSTTTSNLTPREALPVETYTPRGSTSVARQMEDLTRRGSAYVEDARKQGLRLASGRGLMNSSLAADTAQTAALRAALPIAQQDAQTEANREALFDNYRYGRQRDSESISSQERIEASRQELQRWQTGSDQEFTAGQNQLERDFTAGENRQERDFRSGESAADRDFTAGQNREDRDFRAGESAADRDFTAGENREQRDFTAAENEAQRGFQREETQADRDFRADQEALQREQETRIENMRIGADEKRNLTSLTDSAFRSHAAERSSIMANTAMSEEARTAALAAAQTGFIDQIGVIEDTFSIDLAIDGFEGPIADMYRSILDQEPDDPDRQGSGLGFWRGVLDRGEMTLDQIRAEFERVAVEQGIPEQRAAEQAAQQAAAVQAETSTATPTGQTNEGGRDPSDDTYRGDPTRDQQYGDPNARDGGYGAVY